MSWLDTLTAPEWMLLVASVVVIGAWVAAGTVATREARGRRDGQDSERPLIGPQGDQNPEPRSPTMHPARKAATARPPTRE